jgi:Na+/alanine symporter
MPGFSIHVFVFRFSKILATFLVDEKKVQLLIKEKLIILVLIFSTNIYISINI